MLSLSIKLVFASVNIMEMDQIFFEKVTDGFHEAYFKLGS